MEAVSYRYGRYLIACTFAVMVLCAQNRVSADPGTRVFPGMEIRQGTAVCMVGFVETRLRVALTSGQCGSGESTVTDHDGNVVGTVVLARRQPNDDAAADGATSPVEYEVIALAHAVTASDTLPTGRQLKSSPGLVPQPGLPVCQFRRSVGQRCASISSVSNGRFIIPDMAVDGRDFGGPVYALTDNNAAVIVGLFEGMWRSVPEMESWQAVMQQVYIDGRSQGALQGPPGETHFISQRVVSPFASP